MPQSPGVEEGFNLEKDAKALNDAVKAANLGPFKEINREVVGPAIGEDLQKKGLWATLFSILGITAYIALRFRLTFAIGAIAATFHDILVTLAFLVFFGYDLSLNVIAALLTITGYSVNDTIVIFDRVRENMHLMRRDDFEKVVNESVNQTLGRTLITAGTTFLSVLAALPVRRRGARRLRLHDAGRHRQRHLLDHLHRGGGRHPDEQGRRRHAVGRSGGDSFRDRDGPAVECRRQEDDVADSAQQGQRSLVPAD